MSKVMLPFSVPTYATTQGKLAVGLVISNNPTAYNQVLNQAISNRCTRRFLRGYGSPEMSIPKYRLESFSCIEKFDVSLRFTYTYALDIIKRMLDEGCYIYYHGIDDYYLPGKSWYGTRHMNHDGVICGYDDEAKTVCVAAYDMNWVLRPIDIAYDDFAKAIQYGIDNNWNGYIHAAKVKNQVYKLDQNLIIKNLKEYLDSDFERFPTDKDGEVTGIVVLDYLRIYLDKLYDGTIPYEKMDWREMRPIWEHTKCMLDRICAVENENSWDSSFSEEYKPVVEIANHARMMYALHHKKRRDSILPKISAQILEIKEKECDILKRFIEKMEENIK